MRQLHLKAVLRGELLGLQAPHAQRVPGHAQAVYAGQRQAHDGTCIGVVLRHPLDIGDAAQLAPQGGEPAAEAEPFGRMTIEDLEARMSEAKAGKLTLAIYDNNHKERFDKGHIPGAKLVDAMAIKVSDLPADKGATLVFYCANEH